MTELQFKKLRLQENKKSFNNKNNNIYIAPIIKLYNINLNVNLK